MKPQHNFDRKITILPDFQNTGYEIKKINEEIRKDLLDMVFKK